MELLDAFASRQGHREINATKWRTTEPHRCAGEPRVKDHFLSKSRVLAPSPQLATQMDPIGCLLRPVVKWFQWINPANHVRYDPF